MLNFDDADDDDENLNPPFFFIKRKNLDLFVLSGFFILFTILLIFIMIVLS